MRSIDQLSPTGKVEIPIADRPWPAGSGIDEFPTPNGVRNSKRQLTVGFAAEQRGSRTFEPEARNVPYRANLANTRQSAHAPIIDPRANAVRLDNSFVIVAVAQLALT